MVRKNRTSEKPVVNTPTNGETVAPVVTQPEKPTVPAPVPVATPAPVVAPQSELLNMAQQLEALALDAEGMGADVVAKLARRTARSARATDKQQASRRKKVGGLVQAMRDKGLSDAEIVAALSR